MINCDAVLVEFISKNILTMGLIGGILMILAKQLHWGWLVEILTFLKGRLTGQAKVDK
jgi:hypothetical protein